MMDYATACYRSSFILHPVIITAPGQYITRKGEPVEITHIGTFWCHGCYLDDDLRDMWPKCGRMFASQETIFDIVRKLE